MKSLYMGVNVTRSNLFNHDYPFGSFIMAQAQLRKLYFRCTTNTTYLKVNNYYYSLYMNKTLKNKITQSRTIIVHLVHCNPVYWHLTHIRLSDSTFQGSVRKAFFPQILKFVN